MDTIFAPITAVGNSAITVLRISGDRVHHCLAELGIQKILAHRMATVCPIKEGKDSQTVIDQALVTYFQAPHSFTGEEVVEISLHSSRYIISKVMEILGSMDGVRIAECGEFSKRAFLNGKIDLTQAEGIVDLINSETEAQHRQALRQMQGVLSEIYEEWREEVIAVRANIEAYIDFPDEDLPADVIDDIENRVETLKSAIQNHLGDNNRGEKLCDGLFVAIIGEPNVGKSSLINYLSKRDVAIVSDIPGTTRDVIEVHLDIAGLPLIVADTAGLRRSADAVEQEGVRRALQRAENADIKIAIFDATKLPELDSETLNLIDGNTLVVINKIDNFSDHNECWELLKKAETKYDKELSQNAILVSIKQQENLTSLMESLREKAQEILLPSSDPTITRERYRKALQQAVENLSEFSLSKDIELAAEDLRLTSDAIGRITGKIGVEDILDSIFAKFCLGK